MYSTARWCAIERSDDSRRLVVGQHRMHKRGAQNNGPCKAKHDLTSLVHKETCQRGGTVATPRSFRRFARDLRPREIEMGCTSFLRPWGRSVGHSLSWGRPVGRRPGSLTNKTHYCIWIKIAFQNQQNISTVGITYSQRRTQHKFSWALLGLSMRRRLEILGFQLRKSDSPCGHRWLAQPSWANVRPRPGCVRPCLQHPRVTHSGFDVHPPLDFAMPKSVDAKNMKFRMTAKGTMVVLLK
jgi:hypothetical protein